MQKITSKDNQKVKDLIKLRDDAKERNAKSLFYVEGERIVADTPIDLVESIYIKESLINKFKHIISKYTEDVIYILSDDVYDKTKDTVNSQGIIALVKENISKSLDTSLLSTSNKILILDHIQDPGNLGTIIRVAEAASFNLVILSKDTCDVFNTKAIRATMSSIFRVNIYVSDDITKDINFLKTNGYRVYASTISDNSKIYNKVAYHDKTCLIVGNEGTGISNDVLALSDEYIKIPMEGQIESLNASIATAILCYEVYNQSMINETK